MAGNMSANEKLRYDVTMGLWSIHNVTGLKALSGEIDRQAQMIAFNNAFIFYAATCFAVIPIVFLWRKTRPG